MEDEENKASHLKPRRRKKKKKKTKVKKSGKNAEIARRGNAKEEMEKRRRKGMSNEGMLGKL